MEEGQAEGDQKEDPMEDLAEEEHYDQDDLARELYKAQLVKLAGKVPTEDLVELVPVEGAHCDRRDQEWVLYMAQLVNLEMNQAEEGLMEEG